MVQRTNTPGRRERAAQDKRRRILEAATRLFERDGVGGVTTQQIADEADVAIGTLFRYAATKAELLIMVQNVAFTAAVDEGLRATALPAPSGATRAAQEDVVTVLMRLVGPVVRCVREHPENGRAYLHELLHGDPGEPHRAAGLAQSSRLEEALATTVRRCSAAGPADAAALARVISAVIHLSTAATLFGHDPVATVLASVERQLAAVLRGHRR